MVTMIAYDPKPTVIWELTRACDLACRNCPNVEHSTASPRELWTYEAYKTIDEIASIHPGRFVISGGDPLQRNDLDQLVDYARRRGLDPFLALSPTAAADKETLHRLKRGGLTRVIVPLDDALSEGHDAFRGVPGAFRRTLHLIGTALDENLCVEVNTLVTRENITHLSSMWQRLRDLRISGWNLYLFVPLRGMNEGQMPAAAEVEELFRLIHVMRAQSPWPIRMVEARHERRYELQMAADKRDRQVDAMFEAPRWDDFSGYVPVASESAEEVIFISHSGEVWPGEFLPLVAGNVRYSPLTTIHRRSEVFASLRDPENLTGKCGSCEFRFICGGSRARGYATTGDPFASDPLCGYLPGAWAVAAHGQPELVEESIQ